MMSKTNFYVGMGMGLVVGSAAAIAMRPKRRCNKTALGRTLRTMSDVADSISNSMGW